MLKIESGLVLLALLIAWIYPALGRGWFEKLEYHFSALARRRALSVFLVGVTSLALRAAVLPIEPIPEPIVHDEFGYLLAADTFAHGRLTNPTPPLWEHFETFSILMKPTYQCFAQPAQGLVLALGEVLFGHPFWGVWLSCGLMCAAITWMLQGWIGPEWALLGGLIAVLRYGVFGYWADSYWGGAVGAIGGALVLGALPRIKESLRVRDAIVMGMGLALLANSRPFEGFVFSVPVAIVLLVWLLEKKSPALQVTVPRVVVPLALMLALTTAGTGYYLWRVTGSPVRMPYQIEQQTYAVAPYMLWQPIRPKPPYNNPVIEKMYVQEALEGYRLSRSLTGVLLKTYLAWNFFLGSALTVPFLMLVFTLPSGLSLREIDRSTLLLIAAMLISLVGWAVESFYNPHYSSPATGLIVLLLLLSVKQLRMWGPRGAFLTRAVPVICALSFALRVAATPIGIRAPEFYVFAWHQKSPGSFGRAAVEEELRKIPGKQLVIVNYKPDHKPFDEWVYNEADVEHSTIVWARDLTPAKDQHLIEYFKDRQAWLLEADADPPKLRPYPGSPNRAAAVRREDQR